MVIRPSATAQASEWRKQRTKLGVDAAATIRRAQGLLAAGTAIDDFNRLYPGQVDGLVDTLNCLCVGRIREPATPLSTRAELCTLLAELQDLKLGLAEHKIGRCALRLDACEMGLARLRGVTTSADLCDRLCEELRRSCNFSRVMLSRVDGGVWTPWKSYSEAPGPNGWVRDWRGTPISLDDMVLETQLLTERRPALVDDISQPDIHRIAQTSMSDSYVVSPIMPAGHVIGFLHADHFPSGQRCDDVDRDILWAFAEGFGRIYERIALSEQLSEQRDEVRRALRAMETNMTALCIPEVEVTAPHESESAVCHTAPPVHTTMSKNIEHLTSRETQVLTMIVTGAKNAEIAEQLMIGESTVKSHVKQVLRKLGAVNRSQAITYYLDSSRASTHGLVDAAGSIGRNGVMGSGRGC